MNQCVQKIYLDSPQLLLHRWHELRKKQPRLRIRNAAIILEVSEAELLASGCSQLVIRLNPDWIDLLSDLESLGTVMALTRNDHTVHEQTGIYSPIKINGNKAVVLNAAIDLRLMLDYWHFVFSVEEKTPAGLRHSIQFFDATGTAVHKVYLTDSSNRANFATLIDRFRSNKQSPILDILSAPSSIGHKDVEVDTETLRKHWQNLRQTHDFEKMLNQFQITRFEAINIAGSGFVTRVHPHLFRGFMEKITEIKLPVMLFVSNKGAIQIHCGALHNLKITGPWLNILDENFNLHLDETAISHLYVVEKPTVLGKLTSLELYDAKGNNMALFFGEHKPGAGEDPVWRDLLISLPEDRGFL